MSKRQPLRSLIIFSSIVMLLILLFYSAGYLNDQAERTIESLSKTPGEINLQNNDTHPGVITYSKMPAQEINSTDMEYSGSEICAECHQRQFKDWQNSHHDLSMQHASADTVLGDFDNISYTISDQESFFYKKDEAFYVRTVGPEGKLTDYQILYTFGITPLQQYIVAFPNGNLQMLPIAWDTLKARWYSLQESLNPQPGEWIHWTKGGMNWNSMCADCHTTNLNKNYNFKQQGYSTTWSSLDVSCEACHGPGSSHLDVVKQNDFQPGVSDTKIDMRKNEESRVLVNKCGRCHSRRQQLTGVFKHNSDELLDHYLPAVLRSGLYHSDGQILEEVFVYGSYLQSKMYHNNVSCINCHEPHSANLKAEGNNLCTSCHIKNQYDTADHHHHDVNGEKVTIKADSSEGIRCIDCHMPGRFYMGNDFRRDHSFRVPRPDLTVKYNTPNACNDCHQEKDAQWADLAVADWFGKKRKSHFSEVLAQSQAQPEIVIEPLLKLLNNQAEPAIARASAAQILAPLTYIQTVLIGMKNALTDQDALVRTIAAQGFVDIPVSDKLQPLLSLLDDPVRSVRITAARGLIEIQTDQIPQKLRSIFDAAKAEYLISININADFPFGRHQRAIDHQKQGQLSQAEKAYKETLNIDDHFNIARLNLAQLYYQQQRLPEVEALYRRVIEQEPNAASAHYSLGLLMAELGDFDQAENSLEMAGITGGNPRAWYNLGVLRHQQGKIQGAEQAYLSALEITPLNPDFINGIVSLYTQQQQWLKVNRLINEALIKSPNNSYLLQLKNSLEQMRMRSSPE
jgi:predicted CXXCH cytochrome family protein